MQNLTSTVSHEMRTPLTAASSFITILMNMKMINNKERKKAIRIMNLIKFQLHMLLCFVNDLLDLRQINEGFFQEKQTTFDPNQTIQMIIEMFTPQAKS